MVEVGTFEIKQLNLHSLVFSQGWPSWTMALEGLGFNSIKTICTFDSVTAREEFKSTSFGNTLMNLSLFGQWLIDHSNDGIIFIQGSQSYLKDIKVLIGDHYEYLPLIFACSDPNFHSIDCIRLSHRSVGGVLSSAWSIYFENLTKIHIESQSICRVMHQIVDSVQGPASIRSIEKYDDSSPILSTNDLVPWGKSQLLIRAPSVFYKGELVTRFLSTKELMNAYDLELIIQKELTSFWRSQQIEPTYSFTRQIPIKVLRTIGNGVVASFQETTVLDEDSIGSDNSDATVKGMNLSIPSMLITSSKVIDDDDFSLVGEDANQIDKAARPDDAEADPSDWDVWSVDHFSSINTTAKVCNGDYDCMAHTRFFDAWRKLLERKYRKIVLKSFIKYMTKLYGTKSHSWLLHPRSNKEFVKDLEVGLDAITRAANSTWWSWEDGSTLYFWRWPSHLKINVRDGTPLFVDWNIMPNYKRKQQWPKDELSRVKLESKIMKVRDRRYITKGYVKSLTGFFAVPKAKTDIRVVYDATKCGLNSALWAPNFWLPTIDTVLRNARSTTWFADIDLGEMFLNYPLDIRIRPYAGVDITELVPRELRLEAIRILERWVRTLMGFCPSPYIATQTFAWGEEIIVGNYTNTNNTFFWNEVVLNLPGSTNYDPTMPWVYRWNNIDKRMPAFFNTYIDDTRSGAEDELSCRAVTRRVASRLNYLGQQDAARKRGHPAKEPRAGLELNA